MTIRSSVGKDLTLCRRWMSMSATQVPAASSPPSGLPIHRMIVLLIRCSALIAFEYACFCDYSIPNSSLLATRLFPWLVNTTYFLRTLQCRGVIYYRPRFRNSKLVSFGRCQAMAVGVNISLYLVRISQSGGLHEL